MVKSRASSSAKVATSTSKLRLSATAFAPSPHKFYSSPRYYLCGTSKFEYSYGSPFAQFVGECLCQPMPLPWVTMSEVVVRRLVTGSHYAPTRRTSLQLIAHLG